MGDRWVNAVIEIKIPLDVSVNASSQEKLDASGSGRFLELARTRSICPAKLTYRPVNMPGVSHRREAATDATDQAAWSELLI